MARLLATTSASGAFSRAFSYSAMASSIRPICSYLPASAITRAGAESVAATPFWIASSACSGCCMRSYTMAVFEYGTGHFGLTAMASPNSAIASSFLPASICSSPLRFIATGFFGCAAITSSSLACAFSGCFSARWLFTSCESGSTASGAFFSAASNSAMLPSKSLLACLMRPAK